MVYILFIKLLKKIDIISNLQRRLQIGFYYKKEITFKKQNYRICYNKQSIYILHHKS